VFLVALLGDGGLLWWLAVVVGVWEMVVGGSIGGWWCLVAVCDGWKVAEQPQNPASNRAQ